ncbi:MAG: sulfatase-like hydrolase/transferase [Rubripirellula sp.]
MQIVKQLEQSGVRDNTLVIFTGDNGTDKPIVTPWNGTSVVGGKGTMTDTGTRVPMIAHWPRGISDPGRVADDLIEFVDVMPTVCDVTGAKLPDNYPGDGTSIASVIKNTPNARVKDWIYIWYRGNVMVRNKRYSLVAKTDGTGATLTRYQGPFDGRKVPNSELTNEERAIKNQFMSTLSKFAKTRLSSVDKAMWSQAEDRQQPKNRNRKKK